MSRFLDSALKVVFLLVAHASAAISPISIETSGRGAKTPDCPRLGERRILQATYLAPAPDFSTFFAVLLLDDAKQSWILAYEARSPKPLARRRISVSPCMEPPVASGNGLWIRNCRGAVWFVPWTGKSFAKEQRIAPVGSCSAAYAASPDGNWLACSDMKGVLRVFRREGSLLVLEFPADYPVTTLAFSPDSKWLAAGTLDGEIMAWRLSEQEEGSGPSLSAPAWSRDVGELPAVTYLAFISDGSRLVAAGVLGKTAVVDAATGSTLACWTLETFLDSLRNPFAASTSGAYLVFLKPGDLCSPPVIFDLEKGQNVRDFEELVVKARNAVVCELEILEDGPDQMWFDPRGRLVLGRRAGDEKYEVYFVRWKTEPSP